MTSLATRTTHSMLIGAEFRDSSEGATIDSVAPATGELLGTFPAATREDVDAAVEAAHTAFQSWRQTAAECRAELVEELAAAIAAHAEEFAEIDATDNGSLLAEMRRDVTTAVAAMRYFAGLALHLRGDTVPSRQGELTYSLRVPFGVVGRIIPFNHPLMFAASKIAAPLIAGNTVVLKPSEFTSLSALRLAELAHEILPAGVLNVVTGWGAEVGDALVTHPVVRRLAFTGSVQTGLAIQRRAAESAVKTVTLELGGKNPLIVFPDADLDLAIGAALRGMNLTWQGQSCGSTSRLLVHESIHDEFVERLVARVAALNPGMPSDPDADTGAIVSRPQLAKVLDYVQVGLSEGAQLKVGGERITDGVYGQGMFVRPAVFTDVAVDSRLAQEEIFGPILSVLRFADEADAVEKANATRFGLTASVFTRDLAIAHRMTEEIEAGYVWINEVSRHVPGTPYGGVKDSGIGREEDLDELLSYSQLKSVHIKYSV